RTLMPASSSFDRLRTSGVMGPWEWGPQPAHLDGCGLVLRQAQDERIWGARGRGPARGTSMVTGWVDPLSLWERVGVRARVAPAGRCIMRGRVVGLVAFLVLALGSACGPNPARDGSGQSAPSGAAPAQRTVVFLTHVEPPSLSEHRV